jgi:hypothetical protein
VAADKLAVAVEEIRFGCHQGPLRRRVRDTLASKSGMFKAPLLLERRGQVVEAESVDACDQLPDLFLGGALLHLEVGTPDDR